MKIFLLAFLTFITSVASWGKIGHEIVGDVAYAMLSETAQQAVMEILQIPMSEDLSPLGVVADWADSARYSKFYHWSAGLHYIDVRDDEIAGGCPVVPDASTSNCHFDWDRDCPGDFCVAGAINNYTQRLLINDKNATEQAWARNESLKFLVHFVGDIAQPLHASRSTDKGGNTIHVNFTKANWARRLGRHESNLHSVWDDAIIERSLLDKFDGEQAKLKDHIVHAILEAKKSGDLDKWLHCGYGGSKMCTKAWGEESFMYALVWAYRNEAGLEIQDNDDLTEKYYETRLPIVFEQLVKASVRLAFTLNQQLGGSPGISHQAIRLRHHLFNI